jgi:outer membrane protein TolC
MFIVPSYNLSSSRLFVIIFPIWFLCLESAAQAQPKPEPKGAAEKAAEIKTLLKERHMLLTKVVAQVTDQFKNGALEFTTVAQAQRDLLRATLDLEEDLEKRIALLQEGEKLAKGTVAIAETRFKSGQGRECDVLQAKVMLLEVQIALLREEGKIKPQK